MKNIIIAGVIIPITLLLIGCNSRKPDELTSTIPVIPTNPIISSPATTSSPTTTPTTTPIPTQIPTEAVLEHRSILLISWDAAQVDIINQLIDKGLLPNFAILAENGIQSEYATSVDPSLTASAHISMATGAYPNRTGIVSNRFHNASDSFYWYRQGFDEPIDDAEPVWVSASKAGKKSAVLFFPGGTPDLPGQMADITIGYGIRDAYSDQVKIPLQPMLSSWSGDEVVSYSQPYEGSFVIPTVSRVFISLIDSTDDDRINYDKIILSTDRHYSQGQIPVNLGEWGSIELINSTHAGTDFLFQEIKQSDSEMELIIYHSAVYHNTASNREVLNALNEKWGHFPSGADSYALEHGWISHEDYLYLLERASNWMSQVAAWVYTEYQPDLLMTWQNNFDSAGHVWFLQDERQPQYSPELASQYRAYYERAAQSADLALDNILDVIDLEKTTIMLVGDHGMTPVHTTVYINTILENAGLLRLDSRNYVVVDKTKAFAVASGGAAHIYINLEGHETDGIVPIEEYNDIQTQIVDLLNSISDDQTGEPVFQRVLRQDELSTINLDHPNSGDVFVQTYPGYVLDSWRGKNQTFEPSEYFGQHGYDGAHPDMRTIFIVAGADILSREDPISPVKLVDIAPTIAEILGFKLESPQGGSLIDGIFVSD